MRLLGGGGGRVEKVGQPLGRRVPVDYGRLGGQLGVALHDLDGDTYGPHLELRHGIAVVDIQELWFAAVFDGALLELLSPVPLPA